MCSITYNPTSLERFQQERANWQSSKEVQWYYKGDFINKQLFFSKLDYALHGGYVLQGTNKENLILYAHC